MDHCIVYFSFSVNPFTKEDINTILEQSRRNNPAHNITGMLLYLNGSVIQVLEGGQEAIENLFNKIKLDTRHCNVTQVFSRPIIGRIFADWSMGYETVTAQELENIKEIVNIYTDERLAVEAGQNIVLKMIKLFYESNRRQ
jgi:hypothetical protein